LPASPTAGANIAAQSLVGDKVLTPKKVFIKKSHQTQSDPFDASEDKGVESHGALLARLVQDVSEVYFDDEVLDIKIYDLMASSRKARTSKKMAKKQKKTLVSK
jgi:hypothetical protein